MKVYLVILEWGDYSSVDLDIRVACDMQKAKQIYNEFLEDKSVKAVLDCAEYEYNEETYIKAYDLENVIKLSIIEKVVE